MSDSLESLFCDEDECDDDESVSFISFNIFSCFSRLRFGAGRNFGDCTKIGDFLALGGVTNSVLNLLSTDSPEFFSAEVDESSAASSFTSLSDSEDDESFDTRCR